MIAFAFLLLLAIAVIGTSARAFDGPVLADGPAKVTDPGAGVVRRAASETPETPATPQRISQISRAAVRTAARTAGDDARRAEPRLVKRSAAVRAPHRPAVPEQRQSPRARAAQSRAFAAHFGRLHHRP